MRIPAISACAMVGALILLPAKPSESKLYFDADLKFNPPEDARLHYVQGVELVGTEIEFADYVELGGLVQTIYDEVVTANAQGTVEYRVEFQTYEADTFSFTPRLSDPNSPFGGGPGGPDGFGAPAPEGGTGGAAPQIGPLPSLNGGQISVRQPSSAGPSGSGASRIGRLTPELFQQHMDFMYWKQFPDQHQKALAAGVPWASQFPGAMGGSSASGLVPSPLQEGGGGGGASPGGGGGGLGPGVADEEDEFEVAPIIESELEYIIAQNGRLLHLEGLDEIGDFINPRRNITVRQVWQTSHFLILPEGPVHVGESWKAPWFFTIPYVGETHKIPLTFTLEGITTMERFRVARIAYSGLYQFETQTLDENFERRIESDVQGDLVVEGVVLFDIDRGIVVANGQSINTKRQLVATGRFPVPGDGMAMAITLDRIDTTTPLGNVLDKEPDDVHKLQEMTWFTNTVVE